MEETKNYEIEVETPKKEFYLNSHINEKEKPEKILAMCKVNKGKLCLLENEEFIIETKDHLLTKLVDGDIVLVKIKTDNLNQGNIIEALGHIDDPQIDLKLIAISKAIKIDFNPSSLKQAEQTPNEVSEDEIIGRLDLRDEIIFTIDGKDTKDRDDAISIKKNEKGNYILGVHISDVSHYVAINSPLFKEALSRSTSVYMIDSVIPMIPHKLSNGICSLNPNVDRLTLSCIMEINNKGDVIDYKIVESVINSKKMMTYDDVDKILMENKLVEGYEEFIDILKLCNELSFILHNNFLKHGYLHFKSEEPQAIVDENKKVIDFKPIKTLAGRKIIEHFMLIANKTIAENYAYMPFTFRIHEMPDMEKLEEVFKLLENIGYDINKQNLDNPIRLSTEFKKLYESGNYSVISPLILKAMTRARYSSNNIGHFGLGFNEYTHFTSPIRRFNDLLVHTLIKAYNNPNLTTENIEHIEQQLSEICEHISIKEKLSDEAQEEALKYKMAEYMENHIGEYFNGKIVDLGSKYIAIRLENCIIGRAYLEDIKGSNYYYDADNHEVLSTTSKRKYRLTDYVRVKVIASNKQLRRINFKLVENLEHVKTKTLTLN